MSRFALAVTILTTLVCASDYSYAPERILAENDGWTSTTITRTSGNSGSCYQKAYTYYTSFLCDVASNNCDVEYCKTLTDPSDTRAQDKYRESMRLLAICLPSILGGCCLICCCCTLCVGYYGI